MSEANDGWSNGSNRRPEGEGNSLEREKRKIEKNGDRFYRNLGGFDMWRIFIGCFLYSQDSCDCLPRQCHIIEMTTPIRAC